MCSIELDDVLVKDIGRMLENEDLSDIVLIVGERRIPAHKQILSIRSGYFRSLFSTVSAPEIIIDEPYTVAFNKILQYVYTGHLELPESINKTLEIYILATKYSFGDLQQTMINAFKRVLAIPNFVAIYQIAHVHSIHGLKDACFEFADENPKPILLGGHGFEKLRTEALCDMISRSAFGPFQVEIYCVVRKWIQSNGQENSIPLLNSIRLAGMPIKFLLQVVRRDGFFKGDDILDAVAEIQGIVVEPGNLPAWDGSGEHMGYSPSLGPRESGTPLQESGDHGNFSGASGESVGNPTGQISIKMSTGEVFQLEVNSGTTIQQVKEKIEERTGVRTAIMDIYKPGVGHLSTKRNLGGCRVRFGETLKCNVKKHRESGETE